MRFPKINVPDEMAEPFSKQDFECLAYNIHRQVQARVRCQPLRIVELGSWSGQSTLAAAQPHVILHALSSWEPGANVQKRHWWGDKETSPDRPAGINPAFHQFLVNTRGYVFRTVMPLVCHPLAAASWWTERLDAIVINGDEGERLLRQIVKEWSRHVRSGGHIYGIYKPHTVAALTDIGGYSVDGTVWRHRVRNEAKS